MTATPSTESPELIHRAAHANGAYSGLAKACAIVIEKHFAPEQCARWVKGVYEAKSEWTHDFGGEQFSLGRAFYTHYEEDNSSIYFADAAASDKRVEKYAPGLQQAMRDLLAQVIRRGGSDVGEGGGGDSVRVVARRGWCGPGVHVFPPSGPVASRGGVRHFDTEGLPANHIAQKRPAITLVAMFQTTETDGGLRVWDVLYDGHDHPTDEELASKNALVVYQTGDVLLIDSYRLHQIQPFEGVRERISATVHAAQVDPGLWECWF